MTDIDWSKAPEGATHYYDKTGEWYKVCENSHAMAWTGSWVEATMFGYRRDACIPRPAPSWSGEGLPPAGTVCEVRNAPGGWGKATIKYQGKGIIVWLWDRPDGNTDQIEFASCPDRLEFRPIRTHEQIAKDERDKAIKELEREYSPTYDWMAGQIYDTITRLGYRKP